MATVLPPPSKRQRLETLERSREQQDINTVPYAGSLRIQFFDETTGLPIGKGPVLVPVADATPKNLELLLNTLQDHVSTKYQGPNYPRSSDDCKFLGLLRIYTLSIYYTMLGILEYLRISGPFGLHLVSSYKIVSYSSPLWKTLYRVFMDLP
jgi:hypothetical protein